MSEDTDLITTLARTITEKSKRENPTPSLYPAQVTGFSTAVGTQNLTASVQIAGDTSGNTVQASILCDDSIAVGDMVMVQFDPPAGAYVVARVNSQINDRARLLKVTNQVFPSVGAYANVVWDGNNVDGRIATNNTVVNIQVPSLYQIDYCINTIPNSGTAAGGQLDGLSAARVVITPPSGAQQFTMYQFVALNQVTPFGGVLHWVPFTQGSAVFLPAGSTVALQFFSGWRINAVAVSANVQGATTPSYFSVTSIGGRYVAESAY